MKTNRQLLTESGIDHIISERFTASLMSDSKWNRLIDQLTDTFDGGLHVRYKLIHSDTIYQTTLTMPDFKPFFVEPTLYREVEWLEFPDCYEGLANRDHRNAGTKIYEQDLAAIQSEIQRIGIYALKQVPTGLRLYAYQIISDPSAELESLRLSQKRSRLTENSAGR